MVELIEAGKLTQALPLAQLAVGLVNVDHPLYGPALNNLVRVLTGLNRLDLAEPLYRREIEKAERKLGPDHPGVAKALIDLAHTLKDGTGIPLMRRALAIVEKSFGPTHPKLADTYHDLAMMYADAGDWGEAARLHRSAKLIRVVDQGREDLSLQDLKRRAAELRAAVRAMHRAAPDSPEAREEGFEMTQWVLQNAAAEALTQMAQRFAQGTQPLAGLVRERQVLLTERKGEDERLQAAIASADAKAAAELRTAIAGIDGRLETLNKRLAAEFPHYAALTAPTSLRTAEVQDLLRADEAIIVFLDVQSLGRLPEETVVFAITKSAARWVRVPLGTAALAARVATLRCGLDRRSGWLWRIDGWMPDNAYCRSLKPEGLAPGEPLPFHLGVAHELYTQLIHPFDDLVRLRAQTPLPETADELCTVAKSLGALEREPDTVWLGARATETNLKALSRGGKLARYRVLHFATHGMLAGESEALLKAKAEPGLILSPPRVGAAPEELDEDDGLLTASEVAQLDLDADWVVLSACNTAAGEKGNAESLSGLARAFFYAKARALLVSHWYLSSKAAVKLTTGTFEALAADAKIGRAEALRRAMTRLIQSGRPDEAHPSYWAPFVLVGKDER